MSFYGRYIEQIDPRRLWVLYLVAVIIVVSLIALSHYTSRLVLNIAREDAGIINTAGAQRMLSQRILFLSGEWIRTSDPGVRRELLETAALFKERNGWLQLESAGEPMMAAIYSEASQGGSLTALATRLVRDTQDLVNLPAARRAAHYEEMTRYGSEALLARLDTAVSGYEEMAGRHISWLSLIKDWSFFAALLILFAEAVFIFIPAHIAVRNTLQRYEEQRQITEKYQSQANEDPLTGLANRRRLIRELERLHRAGKEVAVLHVDLDHFKSVNDIHGHEAGDFILKYVAVSLKSVVRRSDLVGRMGGDEFMVICHNTPDSHLLGKLAERIVRTLREPVSYKESLLDIGASIGIAESDGTIPPADIVSNADLALYSAKEQGKGRHAFYDEGMRKKISHAHTRSSLILSEADRDGAFFPVYQPYFDIETGRMDGIAALARWNHPDGDVRRPSEFLPIAENIGVAGRIDRAILSRVVDDLQVFNAGTGAIPRISVNVSHERLLDPEFVQAIGSLTFMSGLISFEVAEEVFSAGITDELAAVLDAMREARIDLEIDRFGEGRASILALLSAKPGRVKLSPRVIGEISDDEAGLDMVQVALDLCRNIDAELIAEGVETPEQREKLSRLGVTKMLGFHFAHPMSREILLEKIRTGKLEVRAGSEAA